MFRNTCQRGRLTVLYAVGSNPLKIWDTHVKDGYISRFLDPDLKSMVVEIGGVNVTILDETNTRRRFRVSNFQSSTQIMPLSTAMPICLCEGWNQIQFNLFEFTKRAYNKHFVEVQNIKINANVRLRRIYFADKLVPEEELPPEFRIYFPLSTPKTPKTRPINESVKDLLKPSGSGTLVPQRSKILPVESITRNEVKAASKVSVEKVVLQDKTSTENDREILQNTTTTESIKEISHDVTGIEAVEEITTKENYETNEEQVKTMPSQAQVNVDDIVVSPIIDEVRDETGMVEHITPDKVLSDTKLKSRSGSVNIKKSKSNIIAPPVSPATGSKVRVNSQSDVGKTD